MKQILTLTLSVILSLAAAPAMLANVVLPSVPDNGPTFLLLGAGLAGLAVIRRRMGRR